MVDGVDILPSANRHGVTDEQINHAIANVIIVLEDPDDDTLMWFIGPADESGRLLEVLIADGGRVIHAMWCRDKFLPP